MSYYFGDALEEIKKIKGKEDGHLDFTTMPEFVVKVKKIIVDKTTMVDGKAISYQVEEELPHRDLGAMTSMHTVAIQQLCEQIVALEARVKELETKA